MPDNKVQKMGAAVIHPNKKAIEQNTKEFLEKLQTELDKQLRGFLPEMRKAVDIALSKATKGPNVLEAVNLNQETMKVLSGLLADNLEKLRVLNSEARVDKTKELLQEAGVIKTPRPR